MILLFVGALLFIILAAPIGFYLNKFLVAKRTSTGFFEDLLTGTAAITVYLNILSIFFKTDYLLLFPVCLFVVIILVKTNYTALLIRSIKTNTGVLFAKSNAAIVCSFLSVLILFTLVPPYNTDSSGYHFLSILWNEKCKAVPGLANLFPQYGYNSSFFVLSAAFSFTGITGQSIYPINVVLTIAFFLWMLRKSFQLNLLNKLLVWLFLIICLRQFPINLSSPSADTLASVLVFYVLFTNFFDLEKSLINWKQMILLSCFAVIIKLSTIPVLLVGLLAFFAGGESQQMIFRSYLKLLPAILLILLPWVIRNVILSGYLVFPLPATGFFAFDWKVPLDIAIAEKLHISHAPRMVDENWAYVDTLSLFNWFPIWLRNVWVDNRFNFMLVVSSLLSPLLVIALSFRKKINLQYFLLWLVTYIAVWFWLIGSPDFRFGYHYLLPCILFPLLLLTKEVVLKWQQALRYAGVAAVVLAGLYYDVMAIRKISPHRFADVLIYPLKSPEYYKNNDLATFRYVMLNNGVKLYIHDSTHHSINAPLPACSPYRAGIKMRGNKLEDGFKTQ